MHEYFCSTLPLVTSLQYPHAWKIVFKSPLMRPSTICCCALGTSPWTCSTATHTLRITFLAVVSSPCHTSPTPQRYSGTTWADAVSSPVYVVACCCRCPRMRPWTCRCGRTSTWRGTRCMRRCHAVCTCPCIVARVGPADLWAA